MDKGLLERAEKDIVIVVDVDDNIVVFLFSEAFRIFLSPGDLELVIDTFDKMTQYQAFPNPDLFRHCMRELNWLPQHPEFDVDNAEDPDRAKACVAHFGLSCGN